MYLLFVSGGNIARFGFAVAKMEDGALGKCLGLRSPVLCSKNQLALRLLDLVRLNFTVF